MKEQNHWIDEDKLKEICFNKALWYIENGQQYTTLSDPFKIAELLYNAEVEKYERDLLIEKMLSYDDEIVEIEELDDMELMDITVGNDNLFFANSILTKNSSGHFMTADFILGIISTDELIALNQARFKQLKNRWGSIHENSSFILNMDRKKMKVYSDVSANKTKPVKSSKFNNIINNDSKQEDDDKPFVFHPSMIRPKKDYSKIGQFDEL